MGLRTTFLACQKAFFRHDYLCHYLPLSAGKDTFSRSLLKFKRRTQPDLDAWIDCSLQELKGSALSPDTIILRALHHNETTPSPETTLGPGFPTALDLLGQAISDRFDCRYLPSLLVKTRPTQSCKWLSREQRGNELRGVYNIIPGDLPPDPTPAFLLIDDILTTGTTMRVIIAALRRGFQRSPIRIFTLARSDYDADLNHASPLHGQTYRLEEGSTWFVAEEVGTDGYSMETLIKRILANSF